MRKSFSFGRTRTCLGGHLALVHLEVLANEEDELIIWVLGLVDRKAFQLVDILGHRHRL